MRGGSFKARDPLSLTSAAKQCVFEPGAWIEIIDGIRDGADCGQDPQDPQPVKLPLVSQAVEHQENLDGQEDDAEDRDEPRGQHRIEVVELVHGTVRTVVELPNR